MDLLHWLSAVDVSFLPFNFPIKSHSVPSWRSNSDSLIHFLSLRLLLPSLLHLQVCQFVVSVNGLNVLNLDYRTVSHLILTGPRTVVMEVMEETDHWAMTEALMDGQYSRSWGCLVRCSGFYETVTNTYVLSEVFFEGLQVRNNETGDDLVGNPMGNILFLNYCWTDGGHLFADLVGWR